MREAKKFSGEGYYVEFSENKGLGKCLLTCKGP